MKALFVATVLYAFAVSTSLYQYPNPQDTNYRQLGDSISMQAQQVLVKNLIGAIQKSGTAEAVAFCNERALPLSDSLSKKYGVMIQRISTRNRNPVNAANSTDAAILDQFDKTRAPLLRDTLVRNNQGYVYYKPIKMAMPTCLSCHGTPGANIDSPTLQVIQDKYPNDKATGYKLNELRGAWKLTFSSKP